MTGIQQPTLGKLKVAMSHLGYYTRQRVNEQASEIVNALNTLIIFYDLAI